MTTSGPSGERGRANEAIATSATPVPRASGYARLRSASS